MLLQRLGRTDEAQQDFLLTLKYARDPNLEKQVWEQIKNLQGNDFFYTLP